MTSSNWTGVNPDLSKHSKAEVKVETENDFYIGEECGNIPQTQPDRRPNGKISRRRKLKRPRKGQTKVMLKAGQANEDEKDSLDSEPGIATKYRLKEVRIKLQRVKLPSGMVLLVRTGIQLVHFLF